MRLALGYYAFAPLHGAPNSAGVRPQLFLSKLRFFWLIVWAICNAASPVVGRGCGNVCGLITAASSEVDAVAEHTVHVGVAAAELGGDIHEDGAVVLITHGDVQA